MPRSSVTADEPVARRLVHRGHRDAGQHAPVESVTVPVEYRFLRVGHHGHARAPIATPVQGYLPPLSPPRQKNVYRVAVLPPSGTSMRIMPSCLDVMKSSPSRLRLM